jgi:hypothetical protein
MAHDDSAIALKKFFIVPGSFQDRGNSTLAQVRDKNNSAGKESFISPDPVQ